MKRLSVMLAFAMMSLASACEGGDGAVGPQGPGGAQGPQGVAGPAGPSGPGTRLTFAGTLDSLNGVAFVDLPAAAGTLAKPPIFACYLPDQVNPTQSFWVQTGNFPYSDATCELGQLQNGPLRVLLFGGRFRALPYSIVVIY